MIDKSFLIPSEISVLTVQAIELVDSISFRIKSMDREDERYIALRAFNSVSKPFNSPWPSYGPEEIREQKIQFEAFQARIAEIIPLEDGEQLIKIFNQMIPVYSKWLGINSLPKLKKSRKR